MPLQPVSKAGDVQITAVGQTTSRSFGNDPDKRVVGRQEQPTQVVFGNSGGGGTHSTGGFPS